MTRAEFLQGLRTELEGARSVFRDSGKLYDIMIHTFQMK